MPFYECKFDPDKIQEFYENWSPRPLESWRKIVEAEDEADAMAQSHDIFGPPDRESDGKARKAFSFDSFTCEPVTRKVESHEVTRSPLRYGESK